MPASQWRHCPGSDNPADIPSRELTLSELRTNALWIHGPEWLQTTDYEEDPTLTEIPDECSTEMKRNAVHTLLKTQQNGISRLINADNYSDIDRLLRVTAYVLFFVQKLKGVDPSFSELTVQSENLWVIEVQTSFKGDGRLDIWKEQLNLFQDSVGIWRCGGRLHNARLPYSTRFPILLAGKHHFITLIKQ